VGFSGGVGAYNLKSGTFTNKNAYTSTTSTQTFVQDLAVSNSGYLQGASQDLFVVKGNFINNSTNTADWNTAAATLQFAKGASSSHNFYIAGADNGASGTNEFAWHTLNIFGQTVHLLDGDTANTGSAQYVKILLGADVNYGTRVVNNIFNDDSSTINIYYDPTQLANIYLLGQDYLCRGGRRTYRRCTPRPDCPPPSSSWARVSWAWGSWAGGEDGAELGFGFWVLGSGKAKPKNQRQGQLWPCL
jgi:hypothetical protein